MGLFAELFGDSVPHEDTKVTESKDENGAVMMTFEDLIVPQYHVQYIQRVKTEGKPDRADVVLNDGTRVGTGTDFDDVKDFYS